MQVQILKSKIHRATITDANLDYEGSITLDEDLVKAAGLFVHEKVFVWNVTSGERLSTYVMHPAPKGSGEVCINGAAAHKMKKGEIIIVTSFALMNLEEAQKFKPTKIIVDAQNKIKETKSV